MYYIEVKEGKCTGNYSIDVPQENYIEVEEIPNTELFGYSYIDGKFIEPEIDYTTLYKEWEELQTYLNETDWYAIRYADEGKEIPIEVKQKRSSARTRISEINDLLKD